MALLSPVSFAVGLSDFWGDSMKASQQESLLTVIKSGLQKSQSLEEASQDQAAATLILLYKLLQKVSDSVAHAARSSAFGLQKSDSEIQKLVRYSEISTMEKRLFKGLKTSELGAMLDSFNISTDAKWKLDQLGLEAREKSRWAVFSLQKEGEDRQEKLSQARYEAVNRVFARYLKENFSELWQREFALALELITGTGVNEGVVDQILDTSDSQVLREVIKFRSTAD